MNDRSVEVQEGSKPAGPLDRQDRLMLAAEAGGLGLWEWDLATGQMTYSPRARSISGFGPDEEVTLDMVRAVTHPADLPRTWAMAQRALDPEIREQESYEYRLVRPDGEVRWVLAMGQAIFGPEPGGAATHYVGTLQDITERRSLEEAEKLSKQRLDLAIEAGKMAVWEMDLLADQVTLTPELLRVLGFPEDSTPTPEDIRARYFPGERERLKAMGFAALSRGELSLESEYRYYWADGTLRWLHLRAEGRRDADGNVTTAVGVLMDITDRKRSEEALRTSEARLKMAQQVAGIGVWDWRLETDEIVWSPEMYAILRIDPARAGPLYEAWLDVLHPEDRDEADTAVRQVADHGGSFSIEFRTMDSTSEEIRWIRSHGAAVLNGEGRVEAVVGVNLDVTEERRRLNQLASRADDLEAAVEAGVRERERIYELSNDLFGVVGPDRRLRTMNPAWERLLGYSAADFTARPFVEFAHPEDRAAVSSAVSSLLAGEPIRQFEARALAADGRTVTLAWSAVPEGDRIYLVGRDVTREREQDAALRQAQKMEAVGLLTGGIAHDFNNLLQAVHGTLDLIRSKPGDAVKVARWAQNGLQAAERGARLTAQLLAFSRAQKLELRAVEVCPLVRGLKDLLQRTLGPMVRVKLELDAGANAALADPTQLEMAVLNLAINARDAMPEGGDLVISVRPVCLFADAELPPGDYVEVRVADSGPGMPPDVAARAFDPFFTTKGVGKGTGLGLSQVYGMARQAGGMARIETPPRGATVVILLQQAGAAPLGAVLEQAGATVSAQAAAQTILIVDDDPDVRQFLTDSLEGLGYAVMAAEDGPSGLAAMERVRPDVMLVDFAMPGMTGAEVASIVRSRRPDLPIVFASGYSDTAAIEAVTGLSPYVLRKPFRVRDLEAVVAEALAGA